MKRFFRFIFNNLKWLFLLAVIGLIAILILKKGKTDNSTQTEKPTMEKEELVEVLKLAQTQRLTFSGKVDKSGEILIVAQTPGVVSKLYKKEGDTVRKGQHLAYIADSYAGGSQAGMAYQIAKRQAELKDGSLEKQLSLIKDQKKQAKKLHGLEEDIAVKQNKLTKKSTYAEYDIAQLRKNEAAIVTSLQNPAAPLTGKVDHIFVSVGDMVNPGDHLAVINADQKTAKLVVYINADLIDLVNVDEPAKLKLKQQEIELYPSHLSAGVVNSQSYALTYQLPEELLDQLEDNSYLDLAIAVNVFAENKLLLPLDAVRLMSDQAFVFLLKDGKAEAVEVKAGEILGGLIEIEGEITAGDTIILSRNIFDGDKVKALNSDN